MGIFFRKWLKWPLLATLVPLVLIFNGGWVNAANQPAKDATNLITKDTITYNNLPITGYGNTPWSPMQLDLQQYSIFQGQTVQRIESVSDNKVLYATGADDGTNTKWYFQDLTTDPTPHQILTGVDKLNWQYDVEILNNNIIYCLNKNLVWYNFVTKTNKIVANNTDGNIYRLNNFIFFGINNTTNFYWKVLNLNNGLISDLNIYSDLPQLTINVKSQTIYFDYQGYWFCKKFNDNFANTKPWAISPKASHLTVLDDNFIIYQKPNSLLAAVKDAPWFIHSISDATDPINDKILANSDSIFSFVINKTLYLCQNNGTTYFANFTDSQEELKINKFNISQYSIKSYNLINKNTLYFTGSETPFLKKENLYVKRLIKPNQDFNLSVVNIAGYGNNHKQITINFNFNPNWQNKNYYLNNTTYYLNYWVNNKTKVTKIPLEKNGGNYQFALSNDDFINYDGKTLHITISANVNGREINNIKLAQANSLFKYDDVNDTYDYIVKNYTPPYWTKARIIGLGVGCVLAIPFLVALFFWLKRQWHKIYF